MQSSQNPNPQKCSRIPIIEGEWQGKTVKFRPDRIVVGLKGRSNVSENTAARSICDIISNSLPDAQVLRYPRRARVAVFRVPEGSDIPALAQQIAQRDEVRYAEPDFVGEIGLIPNDSRYGDQWGPQKIDAEGAWDFETGATGVLIGVIDTGIATDDSGALNHPDLDDSSRYILGTDFVSDDALPRDDESHGTHVAGIAAAEANNATGVAGINWNSPVYICKVFDSIGNGTQSDVEAAVEEIVDYALDHNLRAVINMSAGWPSGEVVGTALRDACEYAHDNGMVFCVITHNDYSSSVRYPAAYSLDFKGVIAVGSTDDDDTVSNFSNTGPEVTVVAPGRDILSTMPPPQNYDLKTGTSMSCPHVAGLAALVWSRELRQTNEQVRDVIINTAVKLGSSNFDNSWGYGRIDAAQAVLKAGWDITLETPNINFFDVPEGETTVRAVKFSVKSFHTTTFEIVSGPSGGFATPFATSVSLGKSTDYDTPREAYLWISYTGTTAGDAASGSVTVRCVETGQQWDDIPISANTIARPTACIMLTLDRSNSMSWDSGVRNRRRIDLLHFAANILADVFHEGNGMGIVSFDQDPHDVLIPVVGPAGPLEDLFDPTRIAIHNAVSSFTYNPTGNTSIGDGIERAHNRLGSVSSYDVEAILVFTDGHENEPRYIADIEEIIGDRVYAVGLGTAQVIRPSALNEITNSTGGYTVLTDELNEDDQFKLVKYFLQIQAGVMNEDIVVDPVGWIEPGEVVKIPFYLNEADMSADVILMIPTRGIVELEVKAPDGSMITPTTAMTSPAASYASTRNVSLYRFTLPQLVGDKTEAHTGLWHAVLRVNDDYFHRYLYSLHNYPELYARVKAHGVDYSLLVHSYSNLRMRASLAQTSYEPGATLNLKARLTEYGAPLFRDQDASVCALLTNPGGISQTIILNETDPGLFTANITASSAGVYEFRVIADGLTARRSRFSREQIVTGFVWQGGDRPAPTSDSTTDISEAIDHSLCRLLHCLRRNLDGEARQRWLELGIDLEAVTKCYCQSQQSERELLPKLDFNNAQLLEYLLKMLASARDRDNLSVRQIED